MADDPLSRLSAAFSGGPLFPFLPALPELPSLSGSGFPNFAGSGSGFEDIAPLGSGFDRSFSAPQVYDERSEQALASRTARARAERYAFNNPDIAGNALDAYQASVRSARKGQGAASPATLSDPMLADSPPNVARWYGLAKKYADQYAVPVEDIMAIIENESGGQPGARSGENPGQGRAVGLMQLIPMYHGTDGADLTDPETNIQRGVRYYASGYHAHGDDSRKGMANFFGGGGAFDSQGNVREDIGDINIKMGPYLDGKFLPAKARWASRLALGSPHGPSGTPSTTRSLAAAGGWSHIVPGGQGRVESGGSHGGHPAVDIFAPAGTPIYAPVDGESMPSTVQNGGNSTILKGADGKSYYFAHARDGMLGGRVKRGQIIGYVGNTGNAVNTPSHLHYAVASNPKYFINWNGSGDLDPL